MDKNEIRKKLLDARNGLAEQELIDKSLAISRRIFDNEIFKQSSIIMCYMDFRNEVRTDKIIRNSINAGKRIALPVVKNSNGIRDLIPYEIKDPDKDLLPGAYGILEPVAGFVQPVAREDIDLVILPGVAFDLRKHRLGYGAGYYDRFLEFCKPTCAKIGIAYELQMVDEIPAEEHDIAMDLIMTECRTIK